MVNDSLLRTVLHVCAVMLVCVAGTASAPAQLSGFVSASYGYHRNPLYNYERVPDQLRQGYLELQYARPLGDGTISAGYMSGLMIFNTFTDRNYYEHNGRIVFQQAFGTIPQPSRVAKPDHEGQADGEEEEEEEEPTDPDSVRSYLDVTARFGARHDKAAYGEFDNVGGSLAASYRFRAGSMFVRVHNDAGMRSYVNLAELSNVFDVLSVRLGRFSPGELMYGVVMQGGIKHFTNGVDDTTQTVVEGGKGNGKGKGGATLIGATTTSTTSSQLAGGVFGGSSWSTGSLTVDLLYRHNLGSKTRYLIQYIHTSMLDEDIYNEFFSYDGPSLCIAYRQTLPLGFQAIVGIDLERKRFSVPALNLNGDILAERRIDIRSSAELWLSRYIELFDGVGLDIALSAEAARNQSNDDYNDFSVGQVGVSIGVGF